MKKFKNLKTFVTGAVAGAVLMSSVAFAANWTSINVVLNQFRIRTNMGDAIQWGDTYTLNNGSETAGSIVYNDTTYLPIRKISELTGNSIYFDSTSNTISLMNAGMSTSSGWPQWMINSTDGYYYNYSVTGNGINSTGALLISRGEKDDNAYNGLSPDPNYQRAYSIANQYCYSNVSDGVIFVTKDYGSSNPGIDTSNEAPAFKIMKISYNFDANSEDGAVIQTVSEPIAPHQMYGLYAVGIDNGKFIYAQNNAKDNSLPIPSGWDYNTIDITTGAIHTCTADEKAAYVTEFGPLGN